LIGQTAKAAQGSRKACALSLIADELLTLSGAYAFVEKASHRDSFILLAL
jgi:hypothetical protein